MPPPSLFSGWWCHLVATKSRSLLSLLFWGGVLGFLKVFAATSWLQFFLKASSSSARRASPFQPSLTSLIFILPPSLSAAPNLLLLWSLCWLQSEIWNGRFKPASLVQPQVGIDLQFRFPSFQVWTSMQALYYFDGPYFMEHMKHCKIFCGFYVETADHRALS